MQDYLAEYIALDQILQNSNSLLKDKVARETRDRLETTKGIIENLASNIIVNTNWTYEGVQFNTLSELSSLIADKIFSKTPILKK